MLVFSPRLTQVSIDDQVLSDLDVLMHLDNEFTIADGEQHLFNLMSFRRLLIRYPNLQMINGWSQSLLEQGRRLEIRVVRELSSAKQSGPLIQLTLQKERVFSRSELTPYLEEVPREGVLDIQGQVSTSTRIGFKDIPSVDFSDGVYLAGTDGERSLSLSMTRLADIFYTPIVLAPATFEQIDTFASQDRTGLDHANVKREKTILASPDLCLREVIHALLMDINLDDEDDYNDDMDHLRRMIRCLSPDGQEET